MFIIEGFEIIYFIFGFDNESFVLDFFFFNYVYVFIIWIILIIVGVVGNGLVFYIVFWYGECLVMNIYIINLVLVDLVFFLIVVLIIVISFVMLVWGFGDGMCKFFIFIIYVSCIIDIYYRIRELFLKLEIVII